MIRLIILRHGETYENLKGISQGHFNSQLTPRGLDQAKLVATRLKDEKIDIAFSSDLDRAMKTCNEVLKFHLGTELILTKTLREQAKGIFEGKSKEERNVMLKDKSIPFHEWKPDGGESLVEVWNKVVPLIEELKSEYDGKNILIVSHGGPIACILTYLSNEKIEKTSDFTPRKNTAVSILEIENEKIKFEFLNSAEHLPK